MKILCKVFVFLCVLFIFSIIGLYSKDQREFEKVQESAVEQKKEEKDDVLSINWDKLPVDCVAWIRFRHPKAINYPVMKSDDNDYYLHRNTEGKYSFSGSVFEDCHNSPDFTDYNTILYGHNMANGTMFGKLAKFRDQAYWKKHHGFEIYTRSGYRYEYEIFNVVLVRPFSDIYTYQFGSDEMMDEYLDKWTGRSLYKTGISVDHLDKIVTLSTCQAQGTRRLIVQGRMCSSQKIQ